MSAPTDLESRLTAALGARADLVDARDLTPAGPPAVVVPLHRRRPVVAGAVVTGLVAAAAVVAVAVSGDRPLDRLDQAPIATEPVRPTPTPEPDTASPPRPIADDPRFAEVDLAYVDPGTEVAYQDSTGVVSADSTSLAVTGPDGVRRTARLDVAADGAANRLSGVELMLGQAGSGYLVRSGEEEARLSLYVPVEDRLVRAEVTGDVPFGTGFTEAGAGYLTWVNESGQLVTRVQVGDSGSDRYDVFTWEVTGPGEGGDSPDADARRLVAQRLGTFCLDYVDVTVRSC